MLNQEAVFWREHGSYITNPANNLGFGNYLWKPFIIHKQLNAIPEGDTLLYLDAGCHLNFKTEIAIRRFREYVEMASSQGSVLTQLLSGSFGINDLRERSWTSPQLIEECGPGFLAAPARIPEFDGDLCESRSVFSRIGWLRRAYRVR